MGLTLEAKESCSKTKAKQLKVHEQKVSMTAKRRENKIKVIERKAKEKVAKEKAKKKEKADKIAEKKKKEKDKKEAEKKTLFLVSKKKKNDKRTAWLIKSCEHTPDGEELTLEAKESCSKTKAKQLKVHEQKVSMTA